jgi:hypothetical protein
VFVRFVGVPTRIRVLAELGPQNAELDIDRPRANWPRGMEQLAAKLFARPVALETRVSRDPPSEPQRATSANGARNANNAMGVTNAKGASNAGDAKGANSAGNAKGASNAEGANNTKGANNAMGASNAKSADNANSAKGASNAARTSSANDAKSARDANAESTARGGDDARRTSGVRGAENSGVATGANPAMATEPAAGITDTTTPGDAREPRWEPWAVLGGSAIAGVVGIGFGVSSSDARDHAASEPHTNQELADLDDRAFGHGLAANILFGVAVAGVATGVVWLLAGD